MSFRATWQTLLEHVEDCPTGASFVAPVSGDSFDIEAVQDSCISIRWRGNTKTKSLARDQFETLCTNVRGSGDGFDLDRLPPSAEPYAAVLTLHPNYALDRREWILQWSAEPSGTAVVESGSAGRNRDRSNDGSEPSIEQMLDNMGDPKERVSCPIEGCQYSHRTASSVARHVSGSSSDRHIWENTAYGGWREFVRKHGGSLG